MYSPKISEENVIRLYHLKQKLKRPMTKLVNDILNQYFNQKQIGGNTYEYGKLPGRTSERS